MPPTPEAPLYLDNFATTLVDPRVVETMLPYFTDLYGNTGSQHALGKQARDAVDGALGRIASYVGAQPDEIVITSGATESNNLAIRGLAESRRRRGDHLISVLTEHHSVLTPLAQLARQGYQIELLEVEPFGTPKAGWLNPENVARAIRDDTSLVSVMLANNEIGVIQPLAEIGVICKEQGVLLHCDATQAVGKLPVDVGRLGVDLMSFSSHKIYGPKGAGALYMRRKSPAVRLEPQIVGGGQQKDRRSGTLNVPGIVGMARALELCTAGMTEENLRLAALRDQLCHAITRSVDEVALCGPALDQSDADGTPLRLPGHLTLAFGNVDGEAMMMAMPEIAVSSGATCASASQDASHVLLALGMSNQMARTSLRFGLGRFNADKDIPFVVKTVAKAVEALRAMVD